MASGTDLEGVFSIRNLEAGSGTPGLPRAAPRTADMTVAEVGALDFGYAPPFGPVWDPVLVVAKVLEGDVS